MLQIQQENENLRAVIGGEIDHHTARNIRAQIDAAIGMCEPKRLILDMGNITFMDSSGIAVVIHALRRVRELDGTLKLRNIPRHAYKVLRAAGIERVCEMEGATDL